MSDYWFEGKVALVTGAASGIGAATALRLRQGGVSNLVLVDRNTAGLMKMKALLEGALTVSADVNDDGVWSHTEALVRSRFGNIDIAVVNAGISEAAPITTMDFAAWRRVLSVNLDGAFLSLRCAMRLMKGHGGSIVVVSSASALKAEIGTGAYGASKAGVQHLARIAAKEGAADGIRVNAIAPGGVETPIWTDAPFFQDLVHEHGSPQAAFHALAAMATPLKRYATAEEIAAQIAFLCSAHAATITGAVLTSDGGYSL